jgi:histidine triad (HIT) family protein
VGDCVFCALVRGEESEWNSLDDIVWRDEDTLAFVSPAWWPENPGHVLVVPVRHAASLEEMVPADLAAVYATAQRVAIALREAYGCAGTSTRQHNDAAAGQEIPHFHVHVFPRYAGDELYARDSERRFVGAAERRPYAERLRAALSASA